MAETRLTMDVNEEDHAQGAVDAPLTLIEYGDYECSHCAEAHPIIKNIQKQMGDRLRFVFRNFPLSQMHPHAEAAAEAAECAAAQGEFWEMHDCLYENQENLDEEDLTGYAAELGLNEDRFAADLKARAYEDKVQNDFMSGIESGVNGTPTFFINGARYDGDWRGENLLDLLRN